MEVNLKDYITDTPDFPKEGVVFKDISGLLADPKAFEYTINSIADKLKGIDYDSFACIDSRGFLIGAPLALKLSKKLVMVRKKGKLPPPTISESYDLEYGKAEVEIEKDIIKKGEKVVIVDDLLATGGTSSAAKNLIESAGGVVSSFVFLINLKDLDGLSRIKDYKVIYLVEY